MSDYGDKVIQWNSQAVAPMTNDSFTLPAWKPPGLTHNQMNFGTNQPQSNNQPQNNNQNKNTLLNMLNGGGNSLTLNPVSYDDAGWLGALSGQTGVGENGPNWLQNAAGYITKGGSGVKGWVPGAFSTAMDLYGAYSAWDQLNQRKKESNFSMDMARKNYVNQLATFNDNSRNITETRNDRMAGVKGYKQKEALQLS